MNWKCFMRNIGPSGKEGLRPRTVTNLTVNATSQIFTTGATASPNRNENSPTLIISRLFHLNLDWFLKGNSCGKNPIILHNQGHVAGDYFFGRNNTKMAGKSTQGIIIILMVIIVIERGLNGKLRTGEAAAGKSDIEMWAATTETTSLSKQPKNWFLWGSSNIVDERPLCLKNDLRCIQCPWDDMTFEWTSRSAGSVSELNRVFQPASQLGSS